MRSKHPGDILNWLKDIVDSCETYEQTFAANKCIFNFQKNYRLNAEQYAAASILKQRLIYKRHNLTL